MNTIVALATPAGNSGVAVIRISGQDAKKILQKITREELDFEPRKMYLKSVYIGSVADKCLVVYFRAPFSYTGEDVVEIQSHGGYLLAQNIIEEVIRLGATLAGRGEFSKRAFINGKLSLDQAEGIIDLINAESEMQIKSGANLMQGELKNKIEAIQNTLTEVLADIEAKLDYPEYDYTEQETTNLFSKINEVLSSLNSLVADSKNGLIIKNGVKVAIVGAPNVGKSSLLNALTKSNKAIVTNIAGTTRDVIEAEYEYGGIIFRLYDTAGIHESEDVVEKIGIDRAIKTIEEADLVLRLHDSKNPCEVKTDKPVIDVYNKTDISNYKTTTANNNTIYISAKTGENVDKLKQLILDNSVSGKIDQNKFYLTNTRHIECVKKAIEYIKNALNIFSITSLDVVSSEIKSAWVLLGEISGTTSDEAIIDKIFSKFCLGK